MTNQELILLPALALVLLTFVVVARLIITRIGELRARRIRPQELATRAGAAATLESSVVAADNFMNLFEMPVLFYFLVTLLYSAGLVDRGYMTLAIVYVALRYLHSIIHVTYNRVMHRFYAYALSVLVLAAMWVRFGWQLIELLQLNARV